jgi:hypothetical protein
MYPFFSRKSDKPVYIVKDNHTYSVVDTDEVKLTEEMKVKQEYYQELFKHNYTRIKEILSKANLINTEDDIDFEYFITLIMYTDKRGVVQAIKKLLFGNSKRIFVVACDMGPNIGIPFQKDGKNFNIVLESSLEVNQTGLNKDGKVKPKEGKNEQGTASQYYFVKRVPIQSGMINESGLSEQNKNTSMNPVHKLTQNPPNMPNTGGAKAASRSKRSRGARTVRKSLRRRRRHKSNKASGNR